jgi:hypothetical protein
MRLNRHLMIFVLLLDIQHLMSKVPLYHGEDAMWERSKILE